MGALCELMLTLVIGNRGVWGIEHEHEEEAAEEEKNPESV